MPDYAMFKKKCSWIMQGLIKDFGINKTQAASILGNIGEECEGFTKLQEENPVSGGQGGYGWCQWTGSRRTEFEKYAASIGKSVDSDDANFKFLLHELHNSKKKAIQVLRSTSTLESGVRRFEEIFEVAKKGYEHFAKRNAYAEIALETYDQQGFELADLIYDDYDNPVDYETLTKEDGTKKAALTEISEAIESNFIPENISSITNSSDSHFLSHTEIDAPSKPKVDRVEYTTHKQNRQNQKIDYIVLHYTTSRSVESAIDTFKHGRIDKNTGKLIRTSSHYIIGRQGELVQMVDDSDAAWHSGNKTMNLRSIGIEHAAAQGDELEPLQETTSVKLVQWLVEAYDIPLDNIIPHDAVHSTDCPGSIFKKYGTNHAAAVKKWVNDKIALPTAGA